VSAPAITIYLHEAVNGWQVHVYDDGPSSRDADARMNAATLGQALEWVAIEVERMAAPKPRRKPKGTA
jgi:hypothetical protein